MRSICQSAILTAKFLKIPLIRCSCLFQYISLPLRFHPLPEQLRLGNRKCNFCTKSTIDYENLLTRAEVIEYLKFIVIESDKYLDTEACGNEIFTYINEVKNCESNLQSLKTLTSHNDKELNELVKAEEEELRNKIKYNYSKILSLTCSENNNEAGKGAVIEVTPGIGGIEAKLFAEEVFEMYLKYIHFKGWMIDYIEKFGSECGGIIKGQISISGESVFSLLKHEAGIHRVQRVPKTEKAGRMQTSTCKVHVLPEVEENEINIKNSDLKIETKLSSGPGGQNVQKTETCVKITHIPTGLSVESQEERYQQKNLSIALKKLKTLLYEIGKKKQESEENQLKKNQAATVLRSDKIRTYHFSQNRVTDHRINHTAPNVKLFMEGSGLLNELICLLYVFYKKESLLNNIARILQEKNADEIFNK